MTPVSEEPIRLGTHETAVLPNVLPLLHMLCSNPCGEFDLENDWFWIDSICINQSDFDERASQVKLMEQIYTQAKAAIVWLAEGTEDTDQAIDFLSHLAERRNEFRRAVNKYGKRVPRDLVNHTGWRSLERLLDLPWWKRVWTLQEFILASNLRFYCGTKSLSCSSFRKGIHSVELCRPFEADIKAWVWYAAWNRRRLIQWYEHDERKGKMSLLSLLDFCGNYQATDPRDRIWAVYGLACSEDRQMIGHPTYAYDIKTLYTNLVKAFVEKYGSLDIIGYAQLFRSRDPDWPSWIPDWRVEVQPLVVSLMVSQSPEETLATFRPATSLHRREGMKVREKILFKAAGDEPPIPQMWDTPGYLTCRGVLLDYIDGIGGMKHGDTAHGIDSTSAINTMAANPQERERLRDSVARSLTLNRQDQYHESSAPVRQYSRELQHLAAACKDRVRGRGHVPTWFLAWWMMNSDLRIRGFTLRDICYIEGYDHNLSNTQGAIPRDAKSFFLRMRGVMKDTFRRIMVTDEGHVGVAPQRAQKGDMVCVLFGCSIPVVLRKCEQNDTKEPVYELIGECYLDGFMDGEALRLGKQTHDFKIQ
ncbi:Heterokaryon incompatibility protein 6, OR allele [Cytospora mali]|uniref:Heterokaryon incompatibility protein 6, OR allele n=1 Tax=Cytospora mali TaxID=578113 RepID=A0A194UUZ7_CYTMA|nr:Heterokaryon incompatibility protein 6, OR allele [Valsa mali var. pyri (nom. inval.)]